MGGGGLGTWSESDHLLGVYEKHRAPVALAVSLERKASKLAIFEDKEKRKVRPLGWTNRLKRVTSNLQAPI